MPPENNAGNVELEEDDDDSSSSTTFYSASSSPTRPQPTGYYYSAPASPMHYLLSSLPLAPSSYDSPSDFASSEFEFSARFSNPGSATAAGSMSSADELFLNGKIRPMKLSSHSQRPQGLPAVDEEETTGRGRDLRFRSRSLHRRARSMSPLRSSPPRQWREEAEENASHVTNADPKRAGDKEDPMTSASSSRSNSSSSSGSRNSKRWIFLKEFLYRSKSEGRDNSKEKFWHNISFSPSKDKVHFFKKPTKKDKPADSVAGGKKAAVKPKNGVGKLRVPAQSAHERLYTKNRAQAEEMRKRTFLPYRQGLLGCLGFSSRGYGAVNGLARTLHPVTSR